MKTPEQLDAIVNIVRHDQQMTEFCHWQNRPEPGTDFSYWTSCGVSYPLDGDAKENRFRYCPNCGEEILGLTEE